MNKPVSVIRKEFIDSLRALINDSHLPPYILSPILADMKHELDMATERQYSLEFAEYVRGLEQSNDSER